MANIVNEDLVKKIAAFIKEHNGQKTLIIDISELNSWTNYFVITTITSSGHMHGLLDQLYSYIDELGLEIQWKHRKSDDTRWTLLDCGDVVIHLMNEEAREFYNLEKLWFNGRTVEF